MGEVPRQEVFRVASQLRDFLREPTLHRPAWIHGDRALPEGQIVLKLALGRFTSAGLEEGSVKDPEAIVQAARAFVREVCLWERSTHYQLLCLSTGASAEAARENYRLLMALLHPDRVEPDASHEWPADAAQRVNEAHDVLSSEVRKSEYDQSFGRTRPPNPMGHESAPAQFNAGWRGQQAIRTGFLVGGVAVALLMLQAWWVNDTPQHVSLLESTLPGNRPTVAVAEGTPGLREPRGSLGLDRLPKLDIPKPPRMLATWIPTSEGRGARATLSVTAANPVSSGSMPSAEPPANLIAPTRAARSPPEPLIAPLRLAQNTNVPAPSPGEAAPLGAKEIELLIARLVSSYEQGDANSLMRLFTPGEPGFFKASRIHNAYSDFFRATRDRRLRVERLEWQATAETARVWGDATLIAQYTDGSGNLERKVPIEIDIALRNGEAGITRLMLFPETQ
jgi:hypothetical protein